MGTDTGLLTKSAVAALQPPERGNRITYDKGKDAIHGFGIRVTAAGVKSFVLNYTITGRERRITIGRWPDWKVTAARAEAKELRQRIDHGEDPLCERETLRSAPTVADLADRYLEEHAVKKRTGKADEAQIRRVVRPELGNCKVAAVTFSDIDRLHRKVTKAGGRYAANRLASLLLKMFALSIRWEMRTDNPAKGVERNPEERRYVYLDGAGLLRLTEALIAHPNQQAANAIRLLLLSGARRGEIIHAAWSQFDLEAGVWTKPAASTKQKREHRVPLSAPARQLLAEMKACSNSAYLFPARSGDGSTALQRPWQEIRTAAGLDGVRLHDLRHTYASILVNSGASLPLIGAMLGHSNPSTTARYAHLYDDPMRAAAERVGAIVTGNGADKPAAEVVPIRGSR